MPDSIVEPVSIQRVAEPGETVIQDFVVNRVPQGTLVGSILGDSSSIRLKHLIAFKSEKREFTEDEINEMPAFPRSIRENARRNGYDEYSEFGRVGPGSPLAVWPGLLAKGEIEFVAPATEPPDAVSATLALKGTNWQQVEIPLLLLIGKIQVDFLISPIVAHQGQEVDVPVRVTLPTGSPSAKITLELAKPHWQIPLHVVTASSGGSTYATLRLRAATDATLGTFSTELSVTGLDSGRWNTIPFQITVKPFSEKLAALERIKAKAAVLSEGPPGPRTPVADIEDAGNGGFVQRYSTGNIYYHKQTGAKWVYGAILQRYLALGGPGGFLNYPLTDENGTPDQLGRYNHFQTGSIYYSPQSGANEIHGKIRDHWTELGGEQSHLGYPRFDRGGDESRSQDFQRFQRGTIQLTSNGESTFDVSDTRVVHSGTIHLDGADANGWAELTISSNGAWRYKGSIRSTGALSYDVAIATAFKFKDSEGRGLAFAEKGDVEGTLVLGGNRAHVWDQTGSDEYIKKNWQALRLAGARTDLTVEFGVGDLLALIGSVLGLPVAAIAILIAGSWGAEKGRFCGYYGHQYYDEHSHQWDREKGAVWVRHGRPCPEGTFE